MRHSHGWWGAWCIAIVVVAGHSQARAQTDEEAPDTVGADAAEASEGGEADSGGDAHQPDQQQVSALLDEEARTRFQLGTTLYRQGRFDDAAREFRAAYEVSHRPELMYNLYLVQRDAGNTREAAEALRVYLRDAEEVPDRGLMEGRLAALERQLAAAEAQASNAGSEGAEGEGGEAEGAEGTEGENVERVVSPPPPPPAEPPSRALPIGLMAGGGAVLAAGVVFAILAKGKYGDLDANCGSSTDGSARYCGWDGASGDIDALHRDDLIADISFGVGGAAVAAGVLVWLLQGGGDAEVGASARLGGGCDAQACGLSLEGSF